ncbi:uncharacterized protein F4817DRAFT_338917 [Daldinia loculata]|uniref:uncharacterized protein n=1 Tax=Daldinia loculata TaxID=103429 RepID=UPI0020C2E74C|nr:uncharacterized protein F4817DRAFT_338917 [Daldinia loculata]KAI1646955.1 hypothetical protein F4817DRAFT_338917 [Daldinia loculata]
MVEAIATFGLAVNIMQVVGVGAKFIDLAWKIWRSEKEIVDEFTTSRSISQDLKVALQHIPITTSSPRDPVEDEINSRILALTKKCGTVAQQIINSLDNIGILDGSHRGM